MDWIEFTLERYNYWIVILLMMTGLYIVFARGNLVKKLVGLNLFQTSVFIFYITMGKIAGGTAPIYKGGELEGGHGEDAGHDAAPHGEEAAPLHEAPEDAPANDLPTADDLHGKLDNNLATNDLKDAVKNVDGQETTAAVDGLHATPDVDASKIANDDLLHVGKETGVQFDVPQDGLHDAGAMNALSDAIHQTSDVIYTNPLPHVLILTAIVVGVATTAVGLALAVRIREAYGTIEEDEVEAIDNVAEFGETELNGAAS